MRRSIRKGLAGLLVAGLAGCTGAVGTTDTGSGGSSGSSASGGNKGGSSSGGSSGSSGSSGNSGSSSGGNGGSSSGGNSGSSSGGADGTTVACAAGVPASSQIPRITQRQYDQVVNDLLGVTGLSTMGGVAPSSLLAPDSRGSLTDIAWTGYLTAAETIAGEVMAGANKSKFISCDPAAGSCLMDTVRAFGRKAFRRPLTDDEVTAFMGFNSLTPKGQPAEVAEAILYGFLASPSFIMLPELAQDKDTSGAIKLNSYEVAARLSFLLWNSVPDDTLSMAADKGQLQSKDQIVAQAQRLLQSPKASQVATTFHRNYAALENGSHWVNNNTHDATKFPDFTGATYTAAMAEFDSFFQDIVANNGTFKDIFTSPTAFVTKDTAKIYGLDASKFNTTPQKTTLDPTKRPGILTRISFLSTFSHSDTTSPIFRGAFVTGRVLDIPTGTPDPRFLGAQADTSKATTYRQAIEALTAGSPCNTCHTAKVNPPGFVLEHYNSVGAWQDKDALGGDINSTADVMLSTDMTKTFTNAADMMAAIAQMPNAQRAYASSWVRYATNRDPNGPDACIIDDLSKALGDGSYAVNKMMADYTQADSFRLRTVEN